MAGPRFQDTDPSQKGTKVFDRPTLLTEKEQLSREKDQMKKWLNHSVCYRNDCQHFSEGNFSNMSQYCLFCIDHWEYREEHLEKFTVIMSELGRVFEELDKCPELNIVVPKVEQLTTTLIEAWIRKGIGECKYTLKKLRKKEDMNRRYEPLSIVKETITELPSEELVDHGQEKA